MKRCFDVLASLFGLAASGWLILILVVVVRLNSPGPGVFAQTRVGRHGQLFTCYKLRTMVRETVATPTHQAQSSSITSVGRWLRKTKLDELPQLWNVLTGTMSLVGPRPCLPSQTELIEARTRLGALDVRPGITGEAQVKGVDMSDPQRLAALDAAYAAHHSFGRDLVLILQTVTGSGSGDRVDGASKAP